MAKGRQAGWLVLADISGYTAFLTGTELEHAHAILEDLLRGMLAAMTAPLRVVKLEGDAILAYALDGDAPDGRALVGRLEDNYHAFRMQLLDVARSSTCTCTACKHAPSLDLKYVLHHGEFVVHDLAGHDDLQGTDVIVVHRLLKNAVAERTGKRAYLLATDAARSRVDGIGWADHTESYEHLGEVRCGWRDLHAAFDELVASGSADIRAEDADIVASYEVAAPLATAWDWHVDGDKVCRWQAGMTAWQVAPADDGRVRPGAMVHCAHGEARKSMRILSWRPHRTATFDGPELGWMPAMAFTYVFEPVDGSRTRVTWRLKLTHRTLRYRISAWVMRQGFPKMAAKWAATLNRILEQERPATAASPVDARSA